MPEPGYEPQPVGEPIEYWIDYEHLDKNGQPTIVYEPPADVPGGIFGSGNRPAKAKHMTRVTFDTGEIFDYDDDGKATYVRTDPQLRATHSAANKQTAPRPEEDPYGNPYIWDPNATDPDTERQQALMAGLPESAVPSPSTQKGRYVPAPGMPQVDPNDIAQAKALKAAQLAAAQRSAAGTPAAYRPGEYEGVLLRNRGEELQNQKAERDLMSKYVLAQQQADEAIRDLSEQYAAGTLSLEERDQRMGLIRQNYEAALQGTTSWEKERLGKTLTQLERGQRRDVGAGLAQGLFGHGSNVYGKILSSTGPPLNFNPLAMAKAFVDEFGTLPPEMMVPQFNPTAQALLRGALNKQQRQPWTPEEEEPPLSWVL